MIFPLIVFVFSFLVLEFARRLQLHRGKTWIGIGKQMIIAAGDGVITLVIVGSIIVFFD